MKTRGFTLIELLAVIVILAIIALIAIPKITNIISEAKLNSFKDSVYGIISAIEYDIINIGKEDKIYTLKDNVIVDEKNNTLHYKGQKFDDAQIMVTKAGEISLVLYANKMCATKNFYSSNIEVYYTENKEECFGEYDVGKKVTLSDGSKWHVIKDNGSKITMMSEYNISLEDGQYYQREDNLAARMPYDSISHRLSSTNSYCTGDGYGCNAYEANGTTVIEDSMIKTFTDNYKRYLVKNGIILSSDVVRLVNVDELQELGCTCNNKTAEGTCPVAKYPWLANDTYWTMEPKAGSTWDVWFVIKGGFLSWDMAGRETTGFRPVIEINKVELGITEKTIIDKKQPVKATWMWQESIDSIVDDDKIDDSIALLKQNGFNTLYIAMDVFNLDKYKNFVAKANDNNILVYLLLGDPNFVLEQNYENVINRNMDLADSFNRLYQGEAHIAGIHYDVEYYGANNGSGTCPDGQSEEAKSCYARLGFVEMARRAKEYAHKKKLLVEYDITIYTTNLVTFYDKDGREKNVLDELMKNADGLVVMSYGDSPKNTYPSYLIKGDFRHSGSDPVISVEKNYLEKISEAGIKLVVGQEYTVFKNAAQRINENGVTYANSHFPEYQNGSGNDYAYNKEFIDRMTSEIKEELTSKLSESNLNNTVGFAFHDYKYFEQLYSN